MVDLKVLEEQHKAYPGRTQRCVKLAKKYVRKHLRDGQLLEIGAQHKPVAKYFPEFEYKKLDIREVSSNTIIGDIINCPHIPNNTFDLVFSVDVFEHLTKPWKAADEICRILKPGGIVFISTVFSWRYHPSPIDYWRFSPYGLESLFEGLETLEVGWDYTERRRKSKIEGAIEPIDELGGWRENVRVNYVGYNSIRP
ncbi:Ubiquinone biosynthesis O-methyltransferase [Pseudovibrio sp. Ad46]|uniref:class I SAM-dependent methyltransferase n=1 Tax=unclassified Pseudovibrio TaxID=2627060 RepID=UPI0007AE711A|nr:MULTISPECIES: class I SAM-dependent methyltransferase [unclassified Pseudovibrio]KZK78854.1 Ubiquinone biosynthesis O-methyltransferase [Pseudovibrio sp. Ad46]KZK93670.1 Ubiquinone biosynthesis O-methyltransferase [Pseudovibrio sp. Ad5]